MADQLYLSLWFPNFRFDALPTALISVMRQFALISKENRVVAAAAYPISFSESPVYQRVYVNDDRSEPASDSLIENAVAEATEQLYDDTAYEFEMKWNLWRPEPSALAGAALDTLWRPQPSTVKIIGFGPEFDQDAYEQNGHIRIDFGLDTPWVLDDDPADENEDASALDADAQKHI